MPTSEAIQHNSRSSSVPFLEKKPCRELAIAAPFPQVHRTKVKIGGVCLGYVVYFTNNRSAALS